MNVVKLPGAALTLIGLCLSACSGGLFGASGGGGDVPTSPPTAQRPARGLAAVAVRIHDEDEEESKRIAAFANEALSRHGIRPDATASATLFLRFDRPRTLSAPSKPRVGVVGRGGSSSRADIGLSIQIPLGRGDAPPPPAKHELAAELETAPGHVAWRDRTAMDGIPGARIDPRVARELIERVVTRLARAAETLSGGEAR